MWSGHEEKRDWLSDHQRQGEEFLMQVSGGQTNCWDQTLFTCKIPKMCVDSCATVRQWPLTQKHVLGMRWPMWLHRNRLLVNVNICTLHWPILGVGRSSEQKCGTRTSRQHLSLLAALLCLKGFWNCGQLAVFSPTCSCTLLLYISFLPVVGCSRACCASTYVGLALTQPPIKSIKIKANLNAALSHDCTVTSCFGVAPHFTAIIVNATLSHP